MEETLNDRKASGDEHGKNDFVSLPSPHEHCPLVYSLLTPPPFVIIPYPHPSPLIYQIRKQSCALTYCSVFRVTYISEFPSWTRLHFRSRGADFSAEASALTSESSTTKDRGTYRRCRCWVRTPVTTFSHHSLCRSAPPRRVPC